MHYEDMCRSVQFGTLTRFETGSTLGKQWGARIIAGYNFPLTFYLTTGPMAQFAWDYSRIAGYSEDSTAMRFTDRIYPSQLGALGWQSNTRFGMFNPMWKSVNSISSATTSNAPAVA